MSKPAYKIPGYKKISLISDQAVAELLKAHGVAGWLEIATDGLESAAKQRIAQELEAHYTEAVEDHVAAGQSEGAAKGTALLELGDPRAAAVNFHKSHLTDAEAKSIKYMGWAGTKPFCSFWILPLDIMPLLAVVFLSVYFPKVFIYAFLGSMLLLYLGWRLIPRLLFARGLPRYTLIKELTFWTFVTSTAFGICYTLFLYTLGHEVFAPILLGFYLILFPNCKSASPLRIWNKLRKMGDAKFPPSSAS